MTSYLGLFAAAFLGATLLPVPVSSEAVLAGLAALRPQEAALFWLVASLGNVLGGAATWAIGRCLAHWQDRRRFPLGPERLARARCWFERWGAWTILFAWLPIVGDPICFVAGLLRTPFPLFLLLAAIGKAGRYAVLTAATVGIAA